MICPQCMSTGLIVIYLDYNLHVDLLCEKWECTQEMREQALARFMSEADVDGVRWVW